ncbi:phosphatase PAP2 family protein [Lactiplantibacillus sp. DA1]|uniref:phosphatase PAP2 family protein n=1 Tax=Lactiplantibacillus sp. DA1 TaxID=3079857 RepID=UPI00292A5F07|nr:phosphatase PAP2 family protein [Lactiplantibacillus sp. DA1]MDV0430757.1 phosphatase PAP2 family protein [Lactiplantibacillus sp. DA1]
MLARNKNETIIAWSYWGAFGFLAILVGLNAAVIQNIDNAIFHSWVCTDTSSLTRVFKIVALMASPAVSVVIIVIFSGWLYLSHHRTLGLLALSTLLGGDVLALGLKCLVHRPRPAQPLVIDSGYSFPSGHVFGTILLVTILLAIGLQFVTSNFKRISLIGLGIVWILIVMISRVYLRDHYASDTIGSWLLASGCWYQAKAWYGRWHVYVQDYLMRLSQWHH